MITTSISALYKIQELKEACQESTIFLMTLNKPKNGIMNYSIKVKMYHLLLELWDTHKNKNSGIQKLL